MTEVSQISTTDNASNIAEFKKGKIVFKQKPLSFESLSETMQEIVDFRAYTQDLDSPLSAVPQDYFPLIAKLVQESDKSLSTLTKSLLPLLFPPNSTSRALSDIAVLTQAVERAIKNVAERVNYGISSEPQKPPSSCAVWRWEVKDFGWLPESIRETALTRLTERKQAKKYLQLCFDNFSEEEKSTIFGKKTIQEASITTKEKPDKKSSKVLKEKRETESTKRSAAAFANYFLKAKATSQIDSSEATSAKTSNDFENTFKPFLVKKSVRMSPINWFTISRRNKNCDIVEEDGSLVEVCRNSGKNVGKPRLSGPLSSYFPPDTPSLHPVGRTLLARRQFRKENQNRSVRSIVNASNEAEIQGDQNNVQKCQAILKSRTIFPVKVFVFSENNRPGYLGTWTRTPAKIGPRLPFALDPKTLDYDYDSDAEWEVDESGEDVDSENGSMEEDSSSIASDLDHWLVDGDEIIEDSARRFDVDEKKRKTVDMDEGKSNKKRKVVPLIPFTKGPTYETSLGVCEYDLFKQMRIQMFNDSPVPLNPFDFVPSTIIERTEAIAHNMTNQQLINISQSANIKQNTVNIPKTSFPDAHIEALLRKAATINTSSLVVLVDLIYQDLRSLGIKKNALELKVREVLEKHKETKLWKVKESAWIRYGLTKPQAQ